uniref:Uncharacterized protein n=1 Tax=Nothobranchius furzeri TaxID=105023 RepID=A0A1A8AEH6_NOTFU
MYTFINLNPENTNVYIFKCRFYAGKAVPTQTLNPKGMTFFTVFRLLTGDHLSLAIITSVSNNVPQRHSLCCEYDHKMLNNYSHIIRKQCTSGSRRSEQAPAQAVDQIHPAGDGLDFSLISRGSSAQHHMEYRMAQGQK